MGNRWIIAGVWALAAVAGLALGLRSPAAFGQMAGVELKVPPENVGLDGQFRPACWTPLLVELHNQAAQPRRVICEWTVPDVDGDLVQSRQIITLNPQRDERAWLYAMPSVNPSPHLVTTVRIIDIAPGDDLNTSSGRVVASQRVPLTRHDSQPAP